MRKCLNIHLSSLRISNCSFRCRLVIDCSELSYSLKPTTLRGELRQTAQLTKQQGITRDYHTFTFDANIGGSPELPLISGLWRLGQ